MIRRKTTRLHSAAKKRLRDGNPAFAMSVVVLVLLTSIPLLAQSRRRTCRVRTMIGTVKIRRGQATKWINARPNMPLFQSDAVRTFVESEAQLETSEGTVVSLGENTTMELSAFQQNSPTEQQTQIKIMSGKVLSNVAKLTSTKSRFEFETPTATAAIRGTRVGFDVSGKETQIRVYEGKVFVTPKGGSSGTELNADQMTTVKKGQKTVEITVLKDTPAPEADSTQLDSVQLDNSRVDTISADSLQGDPSEAMDSTEVSSRDTSGREQSLQLTVTSPASGHTFVPGSTLEITGRVEPPQAQVLVRGKTVPVTSSGDFTATLSAPKKGGNYMLDIQGTLGGTTKKLRLPFSVSEISATDIALVLFSPANDLQIDHPLVSVSGMTSTGAEVTCAGLAFPVGPDGSFSGQVPIADEEGEHVIEIEATSGGKTKTLTRAVTYERNREELQITLQTPFEDQKFSTTKIPIRGQITPIGAQVTVVSPLGSKSLPVSSGGNFSGVIEIPAEEGSHEIELDIAAADQSRSIVRSINFQKPPDTHVPILSGSVPQCVRQGSQLFFSIADRTPDDEITFYREVDGNREKETGGPNSSFSLTLEEGCHDYRVYVVDQEGNRSREIAGRCCFQPRPLSVHMRSPAGNESILRLPPGAPGESFAPTYTVQFRIENLPDDFDAVHEMIREVIVTNAANGDTETLRNLTDIDVESDIELTRETRNVITVRVVDVCDQVFTRSTSIIVQ